MPDRPRQQLSDKPFAMVDIKSGAATSESPGHDRYVKGYYSGKITGTIEAITPIQVASGLYELGEAISATDAKKFPLIREMVKSKGALCIPGSSIKGCVRSVVEAVTRSCLPVKNARVDQMFAPCRVERREPKQQLCLACSMFGAMGFSSKIRIADAPLLEGQSQVVQMPALFGPRGRGKAYDRPNLTRKFYFNHKKVSVGHIPSEVCTNGSKFGLTIFFSNLSEKELGLLFLCLAQRDNFHLKLGGGKPVGYGSSKFNIEELTIFTDADSRYLSWDSSSKSWKDAELQVQLEKFMKAGQSALVESQYAQLVSILSKSADPPSGMY